MEALLISCLLLFGWAAGVQLLRGDDRDSLIAGVGVIVATPVVVWFSSYISNNVLRPLILGNV